MRSRCSLLKGQKMKLRIREMRRQSGVTQQELADAVAVNISTVGNWERDITLPNVEQLWNCAVALGCTPNDLLGWKETDRARLTEDEIEIVENYRNSTPQWKQCIQMNARAAAGESKKMAESAVSETAITA